MGATKPGIPSVPRQDEPRLRFDQAVKEYLEGLRGGLGGKIVPLESGATTAQIVDKINALITLLQ